MRRILFLVSAIISILTMLGGCSLIEGTNSTLTYVNEATDYMNQASQFAENAPSLVQEAVNDQQAAGALNKELQAMQEQIASFNDLEAPGLAADLHDQLTEQNERLNEGLTQLQEQLENGTLAPDFLENSEILQTVEQISNLYNQIEQLGGEG